VGWFKVSVSKPEPEKWICPDCKGDSGNYHGNCSFSKLEPKQIDLNNMKFVTWGKDKKTLLYILDTLKIDATTMVCNSCGKSIRLNELGGIMPNPKGDQPLLLHKGFFCMSIYVSKIEDLEKEMSK
jgi:hypothetical protein